MSDTFNSKNSSSSHTKIENALCILLYHGVTKARSDGIENYSLKHLPAGMFAEQMKYIRKNCNVISIDEVVYHIDRGVDFPSNSVAVTFDDGFENNYTVAAPILDEYKIPTTFYISTYFVDSENMFWVDIIEDCINRTPVKKISLTYFSDIFYIDTEEDRIKALNKIKDFCKTNTMDIKNEIINDLIEVTGVNPEVGECENYRKIKWSQLRQMSASPLFTIGGHSHTHSILSQITPDKLDFEIKESMNLLEKNLDKKITHYSYPEGMDQHYNEQVIQKLKAKGIECCPTAIPGLNLKNSDPFHLKRIMVGFMNTPFPSHYLRGQASQE